MKRLTLAAVTAAALFAMPVYAHHGSGNPPTPSIVPKPLPASNFTAEVSEQTYDNGRTRKVRFSWTTPRLSLDPWDMYQHRPRFRGVNYRIRIIEINNNVDPWNNGGGDYYWSAWNTSRRLYYPTKTTSAMKLLTGRYRVVILTQHSFSVPEHPRQIYMVPRSTNIDTNTPNAVFSTITVDVPPAETPPPTHTHPYAGTDHSHAYASTSHTHPGQTGGPPHEHPYATTEHEHPYAAGEHEHDTVPAHAHQAAPGACRWEHRFNTFPAADTPGRGVLRISARKKGARVRIEAFDRADGTGLTVLDLAPDRDRLESGSSVTLGAANTVERFAVEGDSGQHLLIVSHAEHVEGMRAVTASMVRQSGGMSQVIHPDVVEHCEPITETTP